MRAGGREGNGRAKRDNRRYSQQCEAGRGARVRATGGERGAWCVVAAGDRSCYM